MPRTVLLIDDNDELAEALGFWLDSVGFRWLRARTGEDGLRLAQRLPSDSVVLLDFSREQLNIGHFIRAIRQHEAMRELPIVLVTAAPAFLVPRHDVEKVFEKPVPLDHLEDVLRNVSRQSQASAERSEASA